MPTPSVAGPSGKPERPAPGALELAKAALESRDIDAMVLLYADDAQVLDASSGERYRGPVEIRRMFEALFSPPTTKFVQLSLRQAPGWGVLEWTWCFRPKGSDKESRVRGASLFEVRGDKVVRETIFYDPRSPPG